MLARQALLGRRARAARPDLPEPGRRVLAEHWGPPDLAGRLALREPALLAREVQPDRVELSASPGRVAQRDLPGPPARVARLDRVGR